MFKQYKTTEFTDYESWLKRVEGIIGHRHYEYLEWDTVVNEIDLESMYKSHHSPRQAADAAARIIYDLK